LLTALAWLLCGLPPCVLLTGVAGAAPLDPPAREVLLEAQQIVKEMKHSPRGPYRRIRWFCNDGTTQPPQPYACREHGGGRQHAEYSVERARLAELGWHVGTIFAAFDVAEAQERLPREQRLRELALERYLIDVENGWVLEQAQAYRGRVQLEDEQAAGRQILLDLYADDAWFEENYLLARELARVVPHGEESDLARRVRRTAVELAALDPAAERWRAEIHSTPDRTTAGRLRAWLDTRPDPQVLASGRQLADDLDQLYGAAGRRGRMRERLAALRGTAGAAQWREAVAEVLTLPLPQRVAGICDALYTARASVLRGLPAAARLNVLDALGELETEAQLAYAELATTTDPSRGELLQRARTLLGCAYGSGLLSAGERGFVERALDYGERDTIPLADYRHAVGILKRVPGWAIGTLRHTFAEPLASYTALDSRAARFSDDLLRGSPLWMLGDSLQRLAADASRLSGSVVDIAGGAAAAAIVLNPGVARGTLRIFATLDEAAAGSMLPTDVVVLPETIAELAPVAGILTLGEGNPVSHVQLLARNFAIPNVAIDAAVAEQLAALEGREVVLVAGTSGEVVLRAADAATLEALAAPAAEGAPERVSVPLPDLAHRQILRLADIHQGLSGAVVGPKAANLGELNRLFPGRVAPALAIPFGVYASTLAGAGLDARIRRAFAERARGLLTEAQLLAELADVRQRIAALELDEPVREELRAAMQDEFGDMSGRGLFVRSDTNVEDLPQFTGAGLNETIANVVGREQQLAAITRVWSSVLSPRALAWRASVLANPERIYASVLLMQSVPADKSGVLVTANLYERGRRGLTVSAAWGVGGAVAGEAAETLLLTDDDRELVSQAKAPYRRRLDPAGGIGWEPAQAGAVLTDSDIVLLRGLADEVRQKYRPVADDDGVPRPWDIEFGFVDGELTLFQIRPLVERTNRNADNVLHRLRPGAHARAPADTAVRLHDSPRAEQP